MFAQRCLIVLSFVLAGCSATEFSSKSATLSSKTVFGDSEYLGSGIKSPGTDDVGGSIRSPAGSDDASGSLRSSILDLATGRLRTPATGEPDGSSGRVSQRDGTDDEIDISLMCSDNRSEEAANFKRAVAESLPVELLIETTACTKDVSEIKSIVQKKSFSIEDAKRLCPDLVPASGQWADVSIKVNGKKYNSSRGVITLLYALNRDTSPAVQAGDALCDERSSPLVVHVTSDVNRPRPIELSSPADGVDFDLLGAADGYQSVRISWFTNQDYLLLALPDAAGQVKGIDQLFGNATLGPDGRFADNGYAALSKYDGTTVDGHFRVARSDGRIDHRDPIFQRLRLWQDRNFDGVSQAGELIPLRAARVAYIDLDFSSDYAETDQYGNRTMMKSVVGYMDGTLDLIFDLWFAYR